MTYNDYQSAERYQTENADRYNDFDNNSIYHKLYVDDYNDIGQIEQQTQPNHFRMRQI